jgi:7-cyano-7-deazaguanine synthase
MTSVVLLSGGFDSAVCLWMARQTGEVTALCVDYGQIASESERRRAASLAAAAGAAFVHIAMPGYGAAVRSALTGDGDASDVAATVVPGRNAVLLSVAAGVAQTVGAERVWIGCNRTDADNYRDCREYFLREIGEGLAVYGVKIERPLISLRKSEVLKTAASLGVPMGLCSSCYLGTDCGKCAACKTTAAAKE